MKLKKYVIGFIMALCCLTPAEALDVSAHSAILMDGTTGRVLYEKAADEKSLIASTTKIMTALVTIERGKLNETVEIPPEAVGIEGSSMYLRAGEKLTVEELLHGLMLSSGNDAAVALAVHVAGNVERFVDLMNRKAAELGLSSTRFANPNGLDSDENYSTARELGKLTVCAMGNPDFCRIVSAKTYVSGQRVMQNHNKLLWLYEGAVGVKTGFTRKAGRILVGAAERNGRMLISVTLNAPNDWQDHKKLLDYGFDQYVEKQIISPGEILGELPVISAIRETVPVVSGGEVCLWLLPDEVPEVKLELPAFIYAPVEEHREVGWGRVYLDGIPVDSVLLKTAEGTEQIPVKKHFWESLCAHVCAHTYGP